MYSESLSAETITYGEERPNISISYSDLVNYCLTGLPSEIPLWIIEHYIHLLCSVAVHYHLEERRSFSRDLHRGLSSS